MSNTLSEYDQQALDFLTLTGAKVEIKLADNQTCPEHWEKCKPYRYEDGFNFPSKRKITVPHSHGLKYTVTISREGRKAYTFDFWSSINETYKKEVEHLNRNFHHTIDMVRVYRTAIKPSAYDIFACLSCGTGTHELTFEEFCSDYGYDTDSRKAEKVYNAACDESRALARLFSEEELDKLREIN